MTKFDRDLLLDFTIQYGIDLWIFAQLFINDGKTKPRDYQTYRECWRDISRKPIIKEDFNKICSLLEHYMKGKK